MPRTLNPEVKAKWIAALESGEYPKGRHALNSKDDGFCCLGVLCDLYRKETGKGEWKDNDSSNLAFVIGDHSELGYTPLAVLSWAGLPTDAQYSLAQVNDRRTSTTFAPVVELIKKL